MPRAPRRFPYGIPQHVVNRGNLRAQVFRETADYFGFLAAMVDAAERTVVRVMAFCLMPNHFHLILWPYRGDEISAYMQILMNAHIRDLQGRHGTSGTGHIYQGRYKAVAIETERQFMNTCRYVEANALTAGLVDRAQDWRWCSLTTRGPAAGIDLLSEWPVRRPKAWRDLVNRVPFAGEMFSESEISVPKVSATRG